MSLCIFCSCEKQVAEEGEEMKERGLIGTPDSTLFSPWAVKGRDGNHKLGGL